MRQCAKPMMQNDSLQYSSGYLWRKSVWKNIFRATCILWGFSFPFQSAFVFRKPTFPSARVVSDFFIFFLSRLGWNQFVCMMRVVHRDWSPFGFLIIIFYIFLIFPQLEATEEVPVRKHSLKRPDFNTVSDSNTCLAGRVQHPVYANTG